MIFYEFLISQYNPSYTGWAIQRLEPYTKAQEQDTGLCTFAKCTMGAVSNFVLSIAAVIELAIEGPLLALANLYCSIGVVSTKNVIAFSHQTHVTFMYLCLAVSRIVTNFFKTPRLENTEKWIQTQLMPQDNSFISHALLIELSKKIKSGETKGTDLVWAMEAAARAVDFQDPILRAEALELFLAIVESKTGYLPAYNCALELLNDKEERVRIKADKVICRLYNLGYSQSEIFPILVHLSKQSRS